MVTIEMIVEQDKISHPRRSKRIQAVFVAVICYKKIEAIFDDLKDFMSNIIPSRKQKSLRTHQQAG